jgi:CRP-like cAMP-binding protein
MLAGKRGTVAFLTPAELEASARRLSKSTKDKKDGSFRTQKKTESSPQKDAQKAAVKKAATDKFRRLAQRVIAHKRLKSPDDAAAAQQHEKVVAPFGPATIYRRVRAQLDPVKHRHLLGESTQEGQLARNLRRRRSSSRRRSSGSKSSAGNSDDESETRILPSGAEVAALPEEMRATFYSVATEDLRRLLYSRLLLLATKQRRKQQAAQRVVHAARPTIEGIRKNKFFADWSAEALHFIIGAVNYEHHDPGDIILHELEPPGAGIYFLTLGTCQLLRRKDRFIDKRLGPKATVVATVFSPTIFGASCFSSNEPRLNAVRAMSRCDFWTLNRESYLQAFAMLPPETRAAIDERVHAKRVQILPLLYPLRTSILKEYPLFQFAGTQFLDALVSKMQPLAAAPGYTFCREGDPVTFMFVIRFGTVNVMRKIAGMDTHINSHDAPCLLNGEAMLHGSSSVDTYVAATGCDLYTLSLEAFESVVSQPQFADERRVLIAESRRKHMKQLSQAQIRFRPHIYQIPILKQLLSLEQMNALSYLFDGKLFAPLSLVVSASDMCDRIVIVTKGKVSIGKRGLWKIGEAAGYTSIVPHRWRCAAVALEPVESIEVPSNLLEAFLKDCGVYDKYRAIVEQLLFPTPPAPKPQQRMLKARYLTSDEPPETLGGEITPESVPAYQFYCGHQQTAALHPVTLKWKRSVECEPGFVPVSSDSRSNMDFYVAQNDEPTPPGGLESDAGLGDRRRPHSSLDSIAGGAGPTPLHGRYAHLLPTSLALVAGGRGQNIPAEERKAIAARVVAEFDPVRQRRMVQVTSYLWVKQKR